MLDIVGWLTRDVGYSWVITRDVGYNWVITRDVGYSWVQARTQGGGKVGECPPLGPNVEKKNPR